MNWKTSHMKPIQTHWSYHTTLGSLDERFAEVLINAAKNKSDVKSTRHSKKRKSEAQDVNIVA